MLVGPMVSLICFKSFQKTKGTRKTGRGSRLKGLRQAGRQRGPIPPGHREESARRTISGHSSIDPTCQSDKVHLSDSCHLACGDIRNNWISVPSAWALKVARCDRHTQMQHARREP